ncbi:hypothetical protein CRG98_008836 [Punica granatum]|uniref:Uncharacterized protein n=1 Tax=Punica granatum TaxID=22663 RepID=A0A2I0KSH5_PUNGR|nr:hypothetical protein CRG98_008836 [Punica granatum]
MLGHLAPASFHRLFASSTGPLTRASCKSVEPARPCILSFTLCNFAESAHSCFSLIYWACSPVHPFFYASQVHRVCSLVLIANISGPLARASFLLRFASPLKLRRASFLLRFASSPSSLTRASCKSAGPSRPCIHLRFASSPSLLTHASCKSVWSARPCILSFTLRNFAESPHWCFLQICGACTPIHPFFDTSQARRGSSLVLLANLSGLLAGASFLLCLASSPSRLTGASCKSVGPAHPCILPITLRKFTECVHWCFLQIYRVCSPVHLFFYSSHVRQVHSLLLLANLPGVLVCASFLLRFASSPSPRTRASCESVGVASPCIVSFTVRKFAESAHSCFLQICGACWPVHPFTLRKFAESAHWCFLQIYRVCSPCILSFKLRKFSESAHSCFFQTAGPARPCILSFMLRKFAESAHWCFLQIYRVCSPCILSFKLRKFSESAHSCFFQTAGPARPCILSFMLRKFAESAHWCFLQIYRVCSPCILSFKLRKFSESAHSCFFQTAGPARPCILSFMLRKFAESAHSCFLQICGACWPVHPFTLRKFAESADSCFLQICRVCSSIHPFFYASQVRRVRSLACSPVHPFFYASQLRRVPSLGLLANLRGLHARSSILLRFASPLSLLTRASCKSAGLAQKCILSFTLRKFAETAHSCFLQIYRNCSSVHRFYKGSLVHRVRSLVLLENLSGLLVHPSFLLRFATSQSPFTRASCKHAEPSRPCILSLTLREFDGSAYSCFLQICRAYLPVHPFFCALLLQRVNLLVLLANLPGLLPHASFLLRFASSPCLLTRASCKYTRPARPCILSSMCRKSAESKPSQSAESAHSCLLQIYWACSSVHLFYNGSQVRRVCSIVLLANLPRLLRRASFLLRFTSLPSPLSRASCKSAGPARPCILLHFASSPSWLARASCLLRFASSLSPLTGASCKSAGPARSFILSLTRPKLAVSAHWCLLEICWACSPVHPLLYASQISRVRSLVLFANIPGQLAHASFLLCFASPLKTVHHFFYASQVRRVRSLVLLSNLPGRLACASCLLRFASSLSPLTGASCKSVGPACPFILSLMRRKLAVSAHWCLLEICLACSPVHPLFYTSQIRRVRSLVVLANMPGHLAPASFL